MKNRNRRFIFCLFILFILFNAGCERSTPQNYGLLTKPAPVVDADLVEEDSSVMTESAQIEILETGIIENERLILTVRFPSDDRWKVFGKIDNLRYECTRQEGIADRLYCFGAIPERSDGVLVFHLYGILDKNLIFETVVSSAILEAANVGASQEP